MWLEQMNENSAVELSAESCSNVMLLIFPSIDISCKVCKALLWDFLFSGLCFQALVLTPGKGDVRLGLLDILVSTRVHPHIAHTHTHGATVRIKMRPKRN